MICRSIGNSCTIKDMIQHRRGCFAAGFKVSNDPVKKNTPHFHPKAKPIKIVAIWQ